VPNRSRFSSLHANTSRKEKPLKKELFILEDDKQWLNTRIETLEKEIQDLGPDFYDVFNQSSETWHDNAPFDALRDRQSVMFAEYTKLKSIRSNSAISLPKRKKGFVNIGSAVIINTKKFYIAGDWTPHAGIALDGQIVVSAQSPLGQSVLGKKQGEQTPFGRIETIIES